MFSQYTWITEPSNDELCCPYTHELEKEVAEDLQVVWRCAAYSRFACISCRVYKLSGWDQWGLVYKLFGVG